jgi:hypothetical protein
LNKQAFAGAIGAVGLVFQIILGFALAGSGAPKGSALILPHILIGIGGIALLAYLVSSIFLVPSSFISRGVFALAFVLTLAQVALGFRELSEPSTMLLMAHEGLAFLILILLALGGVLSGRARRSLATTTPAVNPK